MLLSYIFHVFLKMWFDHVWRPISKTWEMFHNAAYISLTDCNVKRVKRWRCVHLVSSWLKAAWSCWSRLSAASSRPWASATSSSLKHKHTLLSILINWIWLIWFIKCPKQWQIMTKWGHYSQTDVKHKFSAYTTPRRWKTIFLLQYNFYTMHFFYLLSPVSAFGPGHSAAVWSSHLL